CRGPRGAATRTNRKGDSVPGFAVAALSADRARGSLQGGSSMRITSTLHHVALLLTVSSALATSIASAQESPITLKEMGSFHVGGRLVEISGKPVKEVVFSPGGVPAKV